MSSTTASRQPDDFSHKLIARVLTGVIPLLLLSAVAALVVLPPEAGARTAGAVIAASLAVAALRVWVAPRVKTPLHAELLALLYHLVILVLSAAVMLFVGAPTAEKAFLIITVSAGIFFRGLPWFLAVAVLAVATWFGSSVAGGGKIDSVSLVFQALIAPGVGLIVLFASRRLSDSLRGEATLRNERLERLVEERRRAEIELRAAQQRLERQRRLESLGLLAGGVAHDFNNLLVAILGFAELGSAPGRDAEELRRYMVQIARAAQRAAELCDQMLSFSGSRPIKTAPTDANALLRELGELLATLPERVPIRWELDEGLPAVAADASRLQQVLLNLLTNAFEASAGEGYVVVRTRVERLSVEVLRAAHGDDDLPGGAYAVIEIEDRGPGMDEATRGRIFDPFFTTKPTGRGLGLSTALGIVRSHRGAVTIESSVGVGTRFVLSLPIARSVAARPSSSAASRPALVEQRRVLVVDDEASVRDYLTSALGDRGYQVTSADGAEQAFERLGEAAVPFDVAVIDVTMPDRSGPQLVEEMRALGLTTPVVLISGFSRRQLSEELDALQRAGVAFLQKPFSLAELELALRAAYRPHEERSALPDGLDESARPHQPATEH